MYRSICIFVKRLELFLRVGKRRYTSDLYFIFYAYIFVQSVYLLRYVYICAQVYVCVLFCVKCMFMCDII